ncbi:DUF4239 domain-containing protein [Streptantibioticus rubrisoli]|uniref:DUF4239 domain-containing protein n=1 Tax=Streptantibioticus rubrisoli TaxID=1387313 RepID=A0ABT1P981_9ACTN|nr:DUF4239 domain-containing protein [Streptantibioticus rubrisoli]MCQ4040813.1 DUF4239 domain-containing protein [Streptantibioticus rubrisoli]
MSWSDAVIFVAAMAVIAFGLWLVQRFVPYARREEHNDVAGFIFAGVGVLYAVLLAFVVVGVWENVETARKTTFQEADALAGVYWISRAMPLPLGSQIEHETLEYAHAVRDTEWPLMAKHESSPQATQLVYDIRNSVLSFQPTTPQRQVMYDHAVTHVEDLASARRQRLNQVEDSVPRILWIALITGAVLTVGFTFLFGLSNTPAHTLMVLTLSALVVISLILIKEMDYPFDGVTRVDPTAIEVFLQRLPPPR